MQTTGNASLSVVYILCMLLVGCGGGGSDSGAGKADVSNPGPNVGGTYKGRSGGFVIDRKFYVNSASLEVTIRPGGNVSINWVSRGTTINLEGRMNSENSFTTSFIGAEEFISSAGEFCSSTVSMTGRYDRGVIFGEVQISLDCDSGKFTGSRDYFAEKG